MMKNLIALLATCLACSAQTSIQVVYSFVNGSGVTQTVKQVSFTPLTLNALGNAIIIGDENKYVVTGTTFTNTLITGTPYRVKYFASAYPPNPTTIFTNYFPLSLTNGSVVNATDYMKFGFSFGTFNYGISPGEGINFETNGTSIKINSSGGTNELGSMAFYGTNDFVSSTPILGFQNAGPIPTPSMSSYPGENQLQGIISDGTYFYINKNDTFFKFNAAGTLLVSNVAPFQAGLVQNLLEDGDWNRTNNTLIVPAMTNNNPNWNNLTFNVYDTNLNLLASYGVSNNFLSGCSSLVVDNARGKIFALDTIDVTNLYVFSIPTATQAPIFLDKLAYSEPLPTSAGGVTPVAGMCEKNGVLYLAADNGANVNIYTVDPDTGNKNWLTIYSAGASEHEGLDFNGNYLLQCLAGPSFAPVQYSPVYISSTADIAAKSYPLDDWLIGDFDFSTTANAVTFDKSRTAARLYANYYDTLSTSFPPQVATPWGLGLNCGPSGTVCDYNRSDFLRLTNFTLAFEFNATTAGASPGSPFVSKFQSGFGGQFLVSSLAANIFQFIVVNSNNTARVQLLATNATSFLDGNWHEVIATFAGGNYSPSNQCLYLDGDLLGYTANSSGTVGTNNPCHFRIGGSDLTVISTACSYDEVKLWSRAFSAAEAKRYYQVQYPSAANSTNSTIASIAAGTNISVLVSGVTNFISSDVSHAEVQAAVATSTNVATTIAGNIYTNNPLGYLKSGDSGITLSNVTLDGVNDFTTTNFTTTTNNADYYNDAGGNLWYDATTELFWDKSVPSQVMSLANRKLYDISGADSLGWQTRTLYGNWVLQSTLNGNGSLLTNLNASQLTRGIVADARLSALITNKLNFIVFTNTGTSPFYMTNGTSVTCFFPTNSFGGNVTGSEQVVYLTPNSTTLNNGENYYSLSGFSGAGGSFDAFSAAPANFVGTVSNLSLAFYFSSPGCSNLFSYFYTNHVYCGTLTNFLPAVVGAGFASSISTGSFYNDSSTNLISLVISNSNSSVSGTARIKASFTITR